MAEVARYGSWKSPISARLIAGGSIGLAQPEPSAAGVHWIEQRPAEGGRYVVVGQAGEGGEPEDAIPAGFNARSRVPEYGGGASVGGASPRRVA
jgi:hypothetical protein